MLKLGEVYRWCRCRSTDRLQAGMPPASSNKPPHTDNPLHRQPAPPTTRSTDNPLHRQPAPPTTRSTDNPLHRQTVSPTNRFTDKPFHRQTALITTHSMDLPMRWFFALGRRNAESGRAMVAWRGVSSGVRDENRPREKPFRAGNGFRAGGAFAGRRQKVRYAPTHRRSRECGSVPHP